MISDDDDDDDDDEGDDDSECYIERPYRMINDGNDENVCFVWF